MTLKAPPRMFIKRKRKMKARKGGSRDLIAGGVTALLGVALLSSAASALSKI